MQRQECVESFWRRVASYGDFATSWDMRPTLASLYDFLRSESAAAVEPSFREWSCPATAPQLPKMAGTSRGMSEMTPIWSLPIGEESSQTGLRWDAVRVSNAGVLDLVFGRGTPRRGAAGGWAVGRLSLPAHSP